MGPCKKIGGMVISVVLMSSSLRHQGSRQRRKLPGVGSYRARPVSILNVNIPSSLSPSSSHHYVSAILLKFYRYYSTKHSIWSYTNHQGKSKEFGKQTYHMHLGIK